MGTICPRRMSFSQFGIIMSNQSSDKDSLIKGVKKKMSLAQKLKVSFLKNGMSWEAVLLTVCSTHEYYKL